MVLFFEKRFNFFLNNQYLIESHKNGLIVSKKHIKVFGQTLSYETFGFGAMNVLLIPDAIGTGRSDFLPLLEGEDALNFDDYTLVTVDAPGWGKSRPPDRKYGAEVYNNDCECFHHLMKHLGYKLFSVIGWGEGAKTALLMAIRYPSRVQSMVLIGISYYNTEIAVKHMNSVKSVDTWTEERLAMYLRSYSSKEEIQTLWTKYCRFFGYFNQYFSSDLFKNQYKAIDCPVLFVVAEKSPLTDVQQVQHMSKAIKGAKVHFVRKSDHFFHLKNSLQFKKTVEDFLSETTSVDNNLSVDRIDLYCG